MDAFAHYLNAFHHFNTLRLLLSPDDKTTRLFVTPKTATLDANGLYKKVLSHLLFNIIIVSGVTMKYYCQYGTIVIIN